VSGTFKKEFKRSMKKLLIILLALIAWAVIGWLANYKIKAPAIEADIKQRVDEALVSNNLTWAEASVDGRDVTISGLAQSSQLRQHALRTANIHGVNSVQDDMLLQDGSIAAAPAKTTAPSNIEAGVEVTKPTKKAAPAYPYSMNIARDTSGQYTFTGIVPDTEYKNEIDEHLTKVGADPSKVVWNVNVSSATSPAGWEQHAKDSISALQFLKQGNASFADKKAVIQGVATSQNASDDAESFAQLLADDYTTDVRFNIVEATAEVAQGAPLVGSPKYAALSCQTEFNGLLKVEKIQFESGSSNLQAASVAILESVAKISGRCPDQQININGYTDSAGAAKANKALSKKRAEAVMDQLVSLGMNPARLNAEGFGESKPVASNKTEKGRAKNRRIELIVKGLR
jgi:OOP family OmpA-OmpF porin